MKHFNRGISKYANSLHTQLRLGRSFLSAHGFAIGIYNSDLCICSRPETTRHFFTCFLYQEEQKLLHENMSKVIPKFSTYSLKHQIEIFMNGISSEPDPRNISIVFAVQTYILQTKRFNQPPPSFLRMWLQDSNVLDYIGSVINISNLLVPRKSCNLFTPPSLHHTFLSSFNSSLFLLKCCCYFAI